MEVISMTSTVDDDLEKLRFQRMAEIQSQLEQQAAAQANAELEQQAKQDAIAELDKSMKFVLTPEARSRLSSLNLVNPELTTKVKTHLATLAEKKQIAVPVSDTQLKNILSGLSKSRRETTIRRI